MKISRKFSLCFPGPFFMQPALKSNLDLAALYFFFCLGKKKILFHFLFDFYYMLSEHWLFYLFSQAGQALSNWTLSWVMVSDYSCCSLLNFNEEIHIFFLGDSSKLSRTLQPRLFQFWRERGIISRILWAILTGRCWHFLKLLTHSVSYISHRPSF